MTAVHRPPTRLPLLLMVSLLVALPARGMAAPTAPLTGGFITACQAWNFNQGTLFEGIDKARSVGLPAFEMFLWQKIGGGLPDGVVPEDLSDEQFARVMAKFREAGVTPVSAYVGNAAFKKYGNDEAGLRKVFAFAKRAGLTTLVGEPPESTHDTIEKLVKEFDIRFAIHNHRKDPQNPGYLYWNPDYTASLLARRDRRFGVCLDFGHVARSGIQPLRAAQILDGRILGVHLKDVKDASADAPDVPFGKGVSNVAALLAELRRQKFDGVLAVEYESFGPNQLDEIRECVAFIRAHGPAPK